MTAEERAQQAIPAHQHLQYAVAAAIQSAVEAERKRWVMAVMNRDELNDDWVTQKYHDPEFARGMILEGVKIAEEEAAFVAVEAELRRMIPLVCPCWCGDEEYPDDPWRVEHERFGYQHWWHDGLDDVCPASPLHEALHKETDSAD